VVGEHGECDDGSGAAAEDRRGFVADVLDQVPYVVGVGA